MVTSTKEIKKKRPRSPNYPAINLSRSIEFAGKLDDKYGEHDVPVNLVHKIWGYKEYGGAGDQCVAAVKSFGLITVSGSGKERKIRITEVGRRIYKKAPDSPVLLKKCALLPNVHKEIWEHYNGDLPNNDDLLKNYLLWEYKSPFIEKSVATFISELRETISFAKLDSTDIIGENAVDENNDDGKNGQNNGKRSPKMPPISGNTFDQPIPLPDGSTAILRIPRPMSEENFTFIESFLKMIKPNITVSSRKDDTTGKNQKSNAETENE